MNLKFLRVTRSALVFVTLSASFAACGQRKSSSSGSADGETENTASDPDAIERAELNLKDASDGESSRDTDADDGSLDSCHHDTSQRLVCDPSKLDGVPWGLPVIVKQGKGSIPVPKGGVVVPGNYQLVSETVYGNIPPNTSAERVGDTVRRILHVECDTVNMLHQLGGSFFFGANSCYRITPRSLDVLELSGLTSYSGDVIPDSRDQVSYTARDQLLTLIRPQAYHDQSRGIAILGSYTTVNNYVPISDNLPRIPTAEDGGISPLATPTERDPRCPVTPPASGDACSPDPAPLECEYGGDSLRRCTTTAVCVLNLDLLDGTYHYRLDPVSECTPPNSSECPSTFEAASEMTAQGDNGDEGLEFVSSDAGIIDTGIILPGLVCNYSDGICGCVPNPLRKSPLGVPSGAFGCVWRCRAGTALTSKGATCPWPRPLSGDPCEPGMNCEYDDLPCDGILSLGSSMICQSGYWAQVGCR